MNGYGRADAAAVAGEHRGQLDALAADLSGGTPIDDGSWRPVVDATLVRPDDPAYDDARTVWNGAVEAYPAAVAYAGDETDVARVVETARETGLGVAVRSGGHSIAGTSTCDGGLVLDCSRLTGVEVDPAAGTATVRPGATLGDVDGATQAHSLATPLGVVPDTGATGLTLGGGTGYLTRAHGLACDRLTRVGLVTADGERVTASADANPDLFRALRGGGGNFGVAVELTFDLVDLDRRLATCDAWYRFGDAAHAAGLLRAYRDLLADADRGTNVSPYATVVPEGEGFPADAVGDLALCFLGVHAGDPDRGEAELRPYRTLDDDALLVDRAERMDYLDLQSLLAGDSPQGDRYYWKSVAVPALTDDLVDLTVERMRAMPGERDTVVVWPLGGAVADLAPDETAIPARGEGDVVLNFEATWTDPAADDAHVGWARESVAAVREVVDGPELPNFAGTETGEAAARAVFGDNYGWLRDVKTEWDPENVFGPSGRLSPR